MVAYDFEAIDALFGWKTEALPDLAAGELVEKLIRLIDAAVRFAQQLPPDHYDDVIPGQEGIEGGLILPDGTPLLLGDGTPFIPHHTYFGVVGHILSHGYKFSRVAADPSSDLYREMATYAPLGEPDRATTMTEVTTRMLTASREIGSWWERGAGRDLGQVVMRASGPRTLYQMLEATTYSTAQHTRQLEALLTMLGIEPNGGVTEKDLEGLALPAGIWA